MKKILLATTVLALSAGYASAEIALSGSARMGVVSDEAGDMAFSSRVRIVFTASGVTDGGLTFGASMRADQFGGNGARGVTLINVGDDGIAGTEDDFEEDVTTAGNTGTTNGDSTVYVSGSFGKLTMGDVADGAADNLVGQVSAVGYTDLGAHQEISFMGGNATAARYDYTTGNLSVSVGVGQPTGLDAKSIAVKYATDQYNVALAYSMQEDDHQIDLKAGATFGAITAQARVAMKDFDAAEDQTAYSVSLDYAVNPALTLTGFYTDQDDDNDAAMGIGAAYDLGGGAAVKGGVVDTGVEGDDVIWEAGVTMSF